MLSLIELYNSKTTGKSTWENVFPLQDFSPDQLDILDKDFVPSLVTAANINELRNSLKKNDEQESSLKTTQGRSLTEHEIEHFAEFTIKSYYEIHKDHYTHNDIEEFRKQIPSFFKLNFHFIRHELEGETIAYLIVGKIPDHPYFKQPAWHVGYWGMTPNLSKSERNEIKASWGSLLLDLNKEALVTAVVHYFNLPAVKLTESFNMKKHGYRLSPRFK